MYVMFTVNINVFTKGGANGKKVFLHGCVVWRIEVRELCPRTGRRDCSVPSVNRAASVSLRVEMFPLIMEDGNDEK